MIQVAAIESDDVVCMSGSLKEVVDEWKACHLSLSRSTSVYSSPLSVLSLTDPFSLCVLLQTASISTVAVGE